MMTSLPEQARVLSHCPVWSKTPLQSCYQFLHFPTWIAALILLCLVDKMSDLSHDVFETQYIISLYALLILADLLSVEHCEQPLTTTVRLLLDARTTYAVRAVQY